MPLQQSQVSEGLFNPCFGAHTETVRGQVSLIWGGGVRRWALDCTEDVPGELGLIVPVMKRGHFQWRERKARFTGAWANHTAQRERL